MYSVGDIVYMADFSYSMGGGMYGKLRHDAALACSKLVNEFIVIGTNLANSNLPVDNELYELGLSTYKQVNDCVLYHRGAKCLIYTQERFIRLMICRECHTPASAPKRRGILPGDEVMVATHDPALNAATMYSRKRRSFISALAYFRNSFPDARYRVLATDVSFGPTSANNTIIYGEGTGDVWFVPIRVLTRVGCPICGH
jgi:hypothetical protein